MTQNKVREDNTQNTMHEDNVVTRAQQGHLSLLDWQTANPLQERAYLPKARRRKSADWYLAGVITLMVSAALVAADLLTHLAG